MASRTDARLLKSTKFPPEFNQKVDMQKVNLQVMKKWIANRISEILGNDDDVVIELCFNLIEGSRHPDIKALQIQLTGFLDKDTAGFCKELWKLFLSAQGNSQGVPKELLEAKKLELMQEKMDAGRMSEDSRKQRNDDSRRERETEEVSRDRRDVGRDRQDDWRTPRNDRGYDRGRPRNGRGGRRALSPGSRYRSHQVPSGGDSYVPRSRPDREQGRKSQRRQSRSLSISSSIHAHGEIPPTVQRGLGNDLGRQHDRDHVHHVVWDAIKCIEVEEDSGPLTIHDKLVGDLTTKSRRRLNGGANIRTQDAEVTRPAVEAEVEAGQTRPLRPPEDHGVTRDHAAEAVAVVRPRIERTMEQPVAAIGFPLQPSETGVAVITRDV